MSAPFYIIITASALECVHFPTFSGGCTAPLLRWAGVNVAVLGEQGIGVFLLRRQMAATERTAATSSTCRLAEPVSGRVWRVVQALKMRWNSSQIGSCLTHYLYPLTTQPNYFGL